MKKNFFKIIIISFIFLCISVGVVPETLNYNFHSFSSLINIFRIYVPIFFLILNLILIILNKSSCLNINKKNKYFSIIYLFAIYFFLQLIGLYFNKFLPFNLQNTYLIILGFGVLQIFLLNNIYSDGNNFKYLLYIGLVIFSFFSTFLFFLLLVKNYNGYISEISNTSLRTAIDLRLDKNFFLSNTFPRSTGISRSFGLLNIFIIIYLLFYNRENKIKYIFYVLAFVLSSFIYSLQSRGSTLIFVLTLTIIIFLLKKINLKKKFMNFFFLFFLPFLFSEVITFDLFKINKTHSLNLALLGYFKNHINDNRLINNSSYSSGRLTIWRESLTVYDKSKIFGYGPQGDRFLISKIEISDQYSNNASNALIYSLLCGGYCATIIIILIYISLLNKIYTCIKKFKIFENSLNLEIKLSVSYIIFFILRSFFENSFAVFSIDFLVFICSAVCIESFLKKKLT
jgi:O-antigen ligase